MKYRVQTFDYHDGKPYRGFGDYGYAAEKEGAVQLALSQERPFRVQVKSEDTAPPSWSTVLEKKALPR